MASTNVAFERAYEELEDNRRRPIDLVHLAKQSCGDPGLESEILRMFGDLILAQFARIETSTSAGELKANLHTLRLASQGAGAWGLAAVAGQAEDAIGAGAAVDAEWVADLEMVVAEVADYVDELLEARAA